VLKVLVHVWGFVVEQVNVAKVGKRRERGRVLIVDEVYCGCSEVAKWKDGGYSHGEFSCNERSRKKRYEGVEVVEGQRCRRRLDNLKFYVVFELLAAAPGYRRRCNKKWAYARGATP
jgi:hypothetical protein